ncbi:hypothetical protein B0A55_13269 [Friedmanniomyces simplex]|uniref:F-box domain-containing protein n=1 Tax=Friedmanniomyces simplex TaxID=329884 RepID=A0A4U0VVQ6_9PEZI|nr:hypothetical protein B0A55_13269 [Friedmanniomyces simplex]
MADPSAPRDHLSNVPLELLTTILSHLPTGEIVQAKTVNRHLHSVLTEAGCDALLFKPHVDAALQNLTATVLPLLQPDDGNGTRRTFAQHLAVFLAHRGIQASQAVRIRDICAFVDQWEASHQHPQPASDETPSPFSPPPPPPHAELCCLAHILTDLHVYCHGSTFHYRSYRGAADPAPYSDLPSMAADLISSMPWITQPPYSSSAQTLVHLFTETRDTGLRSGAAVPHFRQDSRKKGEHLPDFPLTKIVYVMSPAAHGGVAKMGRAKRERMLGLCSVEELRELLGEDLPALPETGDFAYCVRDPKAYGVVKRGLVRAVSEGRKMSWRLKAMVLESMLVY